MDSHPKRLKSHKTIVIVVLVALGFFILWKIFGDGARKKPVTTPKEIVNLKPVTKGDIPLYISALGTVTPIQSITIRPQVSGTLIKLNGTEGQSIEAGHLLAQIDPRPYEALVKQYEGQLQRDQAFLANAKLDLERYTKLIKDGGVSQQIYDTQKYLVEQYAGAVMTDQGLLDGAHVNLAFTNIVSPAKGQIGIRLVDEGNVVEPSTSQGIFVVNLMNPLTVIFTVPEDKIPQILAAQRSTQKLNVIVWDRGRKQKLGTGIVTAIDNQIDPTTGTLKIRAEFDNAQNALFPNQFVNIDLLITTLTNVLIVPSHALRYGPNGPFVFIASPDRQKVKLQLLELGPTSGDITVVQKGIELGQEVVVQGGDNLTDGSEISLPAEKPTPGASQ